MTEQTATPSPFAAMVDAARAAIAEKIGEANVIAERIKNADNGAYLLSEFVKTSEDAVIPGKDMTFKDYLERALAEIERVEKLVSQDVVARGLFSTEKIDVAAETAKWETMHGEIKQWMKGVQQLGGKDSLDNLPDLVSPKGTKVGSKAGAGAGVPRPRIATIYVADMNGDNKTDVYAEKKNDDGTVSRVTNFTILSQHLAKKFSTKVEVKDLQAAAFEAAGTQDLSTLSGKAVEFAFSVGEGDAAKTVQLTIVPATPKA